MTPKIERVGDFNHLLGEGPHWDAATKSLYYVDILGKTINKYTPSTKKHTKATLDKTVSVIIPVVGAVNKYLITHGRDVLIINWDGESESISDSIKIAEVDTKPGLESNQINDGKVDPTGRLWAGTIGTLIPNATDLLYLNEPDMGTLYSVDQEKTVKAHYSPVTISNGVAWNLDVKKFYYIDSPQRKVFQFDFDVEIGTITNKQTIFTFDKHNIPGLPDGQCIDTDGNLWVAVFAGSRVIKIDPRKPETLLQTIELPAKQITSVVFGGPNLDELYVTSARLTVQGEVLTPPVHGSIYKVTGLGVTGFDGNKFKLL